MVGTPNVKTGQTSHPDKIKVLSVAEARSQGVQIKTYNGSSVHQENAGDHSGKTITNFALKEGNNPWADSNSLEDADQNILRRAQAGRPQGGW